MQRSSLFAVFLILSLIVVAACSDAPVASDPIPDISSDTSSLLGQTPVQSEGRVKPLSTVAGFTMLRINHKRTFTDPSGRKWKPMGWFMRTSLFPSKAADDRVFMIEDFAVLDRIGVSELKKGRKKRDRYSYNELRPALRKLGELASEYNDIVSRDRAPVQRQVILLQYKVYLYQGVLGVFSFARTGISLHSSEAKAAFGGAENVPLSDALTKVSTMKLSSASLPWEKGFADTVQSVAWEARALALLAPVKSSEGYDAEWKSVYDVAGHAVSGHGHPEDVEFVRRLEAVFASRNDAGRLGQSVGKLYSEGRARAASSDIYDKVEMEIDYYRLNPFERSMYLYSVAALLVILSWFVRSKWIIRSVWGLMIAALALHTYGIVLRCIMRDRPPISTLYETVLFIAGSGALTALIVEFTNRRKIGLSVAPFLGAIGLLIAMRFEEIDAKDTMPQLQAVLDTNFWLATHVIAINFGYAAGFLASALAHVYLLGHIFRVKLDNRGAYREINRMVYGVLLFSLLFTVIGTILGGVWANDSWGRFWGWDPKENGALMIVLSQLAIVHARLGGYIKAFGICAAAIASGVIIAFSWWGVNLLGIGLHTYGFTAGIQQALWIFYGLEGAVLLAAFVSHVIAGQSRATDPALK